jgi:hypothetical protein
MTFTATMFLHCKCGAEVHVLMECDDDAKRLDTMAVKCWSCDATVGRVPAIALATDATAASALRKPLTRQEEALH